MLGGGFIVAACLTSALGDSLPRLAKEKLGALLRAVEQGPAVGVLGLLSPAAVEALEDLADVGSDSLF